MPHVVTAPKKQKCETDRGTNLALDQNPKEGKSHAFEVGPSRHSVAEAPAHGQRFVQRIRFCTGRPGSERARSQSVRRRLARAGCTQPGRRRHRGDSAPPFGIAAEHARGGDRNHRRSEEHTSELQSLMRNSYAVFCLKKKTKSKYQTQHYTQT